MPVGTSESRIYLTVAYGKLRLKCEKEDPKAVWREYEGKGSWAREFSWIEGNITKIFYKESAEYGNSYEVNIWDGLDRYNISFKENSRYCHDFLVKLPNINLRKTVKITPYQMDVEDKQRRGTSIQQDGKKILNFFASKVEDKWIYRKNFPEPESDNLSEKQWKRYLIDMQIFLQEYIQDKVIKPFNEAAFIEDLEAATVNQQQAPAEDDPSAHKLNKDEFDRQLDEHKQNQLQAGPPIVDDETYYQSHESAKDEDNLPF